MNIAQRKGIFLFSWLKQTLKETRQLVEAEKAAPLTSGPPTSLLPTYVMAANLQDGSNWSFRERGSVSHQLPGRPHSKMEQGFKDPAMIPHPGTPRKSLRREACEHRREKSPLNGALSWRWLHFSSDCQDLEHLAPQNVELQNSRGSVIGMGPKQPGNRINKWGKENSGVGTQGRSSEA